MNRNERYVFHRQGTNAEVEEKLAIAETEESTAQHRPATANLTPPHPRRPRKAADSLARRDARERRAITQPNGGFDSSASTDPIRPVNQPPSLVD